MFPWTFWIVVAIVAVFVAVLIARAIYAPIKLRRERRRYLQWKQDTQGKAFTFR